MGVAAEVMAAMVDGGGSSSWSWQDCNEGHRRCPDLSNGSDEVVALIVDQADEWYSVEVLVHCSFQWSCASMWQVMAQIFHGKKPDARFSHNVNKL